MSRFACTTSRSSADRFARNQVYLQRTLSHAQTSLARVAGDVANRRTDLSDVVRGRFETANEATGDRTRFEITYGASGALAEVPIHMAFQPRWSFKVELFLTGT